MYLRKQNPAIGCHRSNSLPLSRELRHSCYGVTPSWMSHLLQVATELLQNLRLATALNLPLPSHFRNIGKTSPVLLSPRRLAPIFSPIRPAAPPGDSRHSRHAGQSARHPLST